MEEIERLNGGKRITQYRRGLYLCCRFYPRSGKLYPSATAGRFAGGRLKPSGSSWNTIWPDRTSGHQFLNIGAIAGRTGFGFVIGGENEQLELMTTNLTLIFEYGHDGSP